MLSKYKNKLKKEKELYLCVKARPGAPKTVVKSILEDETIKIDVAAIAEKGKANQALIKFLSQEFEVDKNSVKIISGAGEKLKLIKIKE